MVLQAVVADKQLSLSLPVTPFTYQIVLARAVEVRANDKATISSATRFSLMVCFRAEITYSRTNDLTCIRRIRSNRAPDSRKLGKGPKIAS